MLIKEQFIYFDIYNNGLDLDIGILSITLKNCRALHINYLWPQQYLCVLMVYL